MRTRTHVTGSIFLLAIIALSQDSAIVAQEQPLAAHLNEIDWSPPGGGNGFPVGVQTWRAGVDPITEGITYYAKFPSGSHFDLHWHSNDEFVVVVQGLVTLELGDKTHSLMPGSYVVIPAKMHHSWDVPVGDDAVIVVRRGGPADFFFVE